MSKNDGKEQVTKEVFDFRSIFRPRRRQLVIWVDSNRKVHSNATGSITSQIKALSALIEYIQIYASMCQDVSSKALNMDNSWVEINERLNRQLKNATNTLELVDKAMKKRTAKTSA